MGEEKLQTFTNFCLRYMSEIKLPKKRCVNSFIYSVLIYSNFIGAPSLSSEMD